MLDKSCGWASHKPMLYSTANRKPGRRWAWSQETTSIRRLAGSSADGWSSSNTGDPFHINKYALNPTKFDSIMLSRFRIMWWFHGKTGGLNPGIGLEKHIKWGNGWKRHIVPSTIRRVKECKRKAPWQQHRIGVGSYNTAPTVPAPRQVYPLNFTKRANHFWVLWFW